MRNIPVTFNHDHMRVIGRFQLDDAVSDEEITNCSISWYVDKRDKSLLAITLIPNPAILNPLHDVVENAEHEFNMKQLGIEP